jgi:glycyl-tRNA synthetase beta chain
MADFLFEIGLEEIPARMIAAALADLSQRTEALLLRERLLQPDHSVQTYSTPRRLAVHVKGVLEQQLDIEEQLTGPSWKIAFKDDAPTAAALAFAKKAGVEVSELVKLTNAKGEYVSASVKRPGRTAVAVITELLPHEVSSIYWPKNMYWRAAKPERFVRPLRWLLALLDDKVVPVEFAGITASNQSYGHRILHGDAPVTIANPAEYVASLERASVIASVETRIQRIRKDLDTVTRTLPGARWREDEPLVDTVANLTEWPSVLLGGFEAEYLTLPEEVLVTVMRDHQKYFAVEGADGKLSANFLAVLNTNGDPQGLIRHGNERVLRARFNDARFFWNYDQKISLEDRVELLRSVTFQKEIGSYFEKTESNLRVATELAAAVAESGAIVDREALLKAVLLAKADLTADLVKEFTELQGIVGGLYARAQGHGETVAQAIYTQYIPASMEDDIPATIEGQILGLADRMSTIVDMFAIGLEPTGSKDPFALRRAGNAVIKILAESGLTISLRQIRYIGVGNSLQANAEKVAASVLQFLKERLEFYLREVKGYSYDVVKAVLASDLSTVPDAAARVAALSAVRGSEDFVAIAGAFKRIKNLLRQAEEKGEKINVDPISSALEAMDGSSEPQRVLEEDESRLYDASLSLINEIDPLVEKQQYAQALEKIAALRPEIDRFFDTVMVMAPDPAIRHKRLWLIAWVLENFSRIADFSEIVSS